MKNTITLLMILLLVGVCHISQAQQNRKQVVKFKRGASGATYKNAVIRGERIIYTLGARKGQVMEINIVSPEKNAVFQIKDKRTGKYLKDAKPGEDAIFWSNNLPSSGNYEIIVGGTRGNASFEITFTIN